MLPRFVNAILNTLLGVYAWRVIRLKFERDAWKLLKKKRDWWIPECMWRVFYFMRYAWFVNYLCLVVKISFPWGFSDNDWFKTSRVNFVKICAWNGITIPLCHPLLGRNDSPKYVRARRLKNSFFLLRLSMPLFSMWTLIILRQSCMYAKSQLSGGLSLAKMLLLIWYELFSCFFKELCLLWW